MLISELYAKLETIETDDYDHVIMRIKTIGGIFTTPVTDITFNGSHLTFEYDWTKDDDFQDSSKA